VQTMLEHSPCTVYKEDDMWALDVRSRWDDFINSLVFKYSIDMYSYSNRVSDKGGNVANFM
jgi:hypothetical protein